MFPVFKAQLRKDIRKPLTVILFIVASIVASLIFGGSTEQEETTVAIFSSGSDAKEIEEKWEGLLNDIESVNFVITDEEKAREDVVEGRRDVAIHVMENDYRLVTSSHMPQVQMIEQQVHEVFTKEAQLTAAAGNQSTEQFRDEMEDYMNNPPFQVQTLSLQNENLLKHDMGLQLLFGFTLFAAMFIIGFKVNGITADKVSGIWDRMILSSVSKTSMYSGHLIYSFCIGFFQMFIVLLVFQYLIGYDLGNFSMILSIAAVYTLSMVSLAMLLTGILRTPEQFNMVFSSVIPMIPIVSGIYMPPGTISNSILLFIADLFPLTHGVEAMIEVALYDASWNDIALPIALMLLIGVVCMGVGVNMVERRKG
ncbi:multidrug ABC transporter permease [Virgibacillus profundi]|uniref:Multidrug ABC transporter permease n=1 Tax=Virgibacillus profundi TaxID=2024555 RepID=A0A2A2I9B6_9BACI|nr:ABC transporter permease [Virgibacillus profundi]PAV27958.1 multidrug ABC transporter permease [Virgibacillus profundi]PXY52136.1 ABC transporter permease [Virgibacillus profundi]